MNGLIITADDFGQANEVNEAVEIAHRKGVLTAASLMVSGPAAMRAIALAKRLPKLRVGLHLTLLDGLPTAPPAEIPDLLDKTGRLRRDMVGLAFALALRPSVRRQLRHEIAAQFAAFKRTGLALDHVNAHKHFHVHPVVAAEVVAACVANRAPALRVPQEPASIIKRASGRASSQPVLGPWAGRLRRRAQQAGLLTPNAVFGLRWSGQVTRTRLAALLAELPEGLNEIYTHPATSDSYPGHARGYRYAEELAALTDPAVIGSVRARAQRSGGYSDFIGSDGAGRAG